MLWRGCVLRVGVLGINFKTAELPLREAIAKGAQTLSGERSLFFPHPTVLLSTCNRTEVYFSAENLAEAQSDLLASLRTRIEEPFEHRLYSYFGIDCFAHLSRVVSGLDSAIVGETEIQRQAKVAYARSAQILALPAALHFLFQKSFKIAKSVRSCIALDRGAPTLFGTLWQIGKEKFARLEEKKFLLVGYSEIHRGFASFLEKKGVKEITFCTQSPHQVRESKVCDRRELERWSEYDVISCASKSNDFLVKGRGSRSHLVFDLSVPRNVDPGLEGASLFNIEQIGRIIEQRKSQQDDCFVRAEAHLWGSVCRHARIYRDKIENSLNLSMFNC